MKYIKLQCDSCCGCKIKFLIALDDWYQEEYNGKIQEYYVCPICESMIFVEDKDNCIIEIN